MKLRPSLLVPGSWHRTDDSDMRNRLVAIDGFGESVVDRYDKRRKYRLEHLPEAIEPGESVSILVMEDRLVAFTNLGRPGLTGLYDILPRRNTFNDLSM